MRNIFGSTLVLILFIGMLGTGSWAYFTDPEDTGENPLQAGTLDLKTDDVDGVTQTIYASSMKLGDNVSGNVTLKNTGTTNGSSLDITFTYIENDDSPNSVNMSPDATAASLEVTTMSYNGSSLLGSVTDNNTNGYKDVEDLKNTDLTGQSGINALAGTDFEIVVKLKETTDNDFQGDGITVTIAFTLRQGAF